MKGLVRRLDVWAGLAYVSGILIRIWYGFYFRPAARNIYSDMEYYMQVARMLRRTPLSSLGPWDMTHPLGFPTLLAVALGRDLSLGRPAMMQFAVSVLVPPAMALLGWAAFGRRSALLMLIFSSLYFPFIEYGALFLSEIHFIFWTALAFAGLFAATRASSRNRAVALGIGAGVALSLATAMKAVVLPAAATFFLAWAIWLLWQRLSIRPAIGLGLAVLIGVAPLLSVMGSVCTRANRGSLCITGNKAGSDFLLGHYGRIAGIQWGLVDGRTYFFGSPGSYLRHYDARPAVPFAMYDGRANVAEAWKWIGAHPLDAVELSLDHVYDSFFGVGMWPSFANDSWGWAHLSQMIFLALFFFPALWALGKKPKRAWLVISPVAGLILTLLIATGEVRYRIPFDCFFMAVVAAMVTGELA
jgi:4-amino-4-deoxy-L-arabinose transferase-like glycosyltransferase